MAAIALSPGAAAESVEYQIHTEWGDACVEVGSSITVRPGMCKEAAEAVVDWVLALIGQLDP